jgi:hypothetical protein
MVIFRLSDEEFRMPYILFTASFYLSLIFLAIFGQKTWALPLLNTDDAGIVSEHQCQIEFAHVLQNQSDSIALTPACHVFNQFEFSVPLVWEDGLNSYAFQIKKPLIVQDYFHIAASLLYQPKQDDNFEQWQLNVPLSLYLVEGLQLDVNLGWTQSHHHLDQMWSLASTYDFDELNKLSLEFYRSDLDSSTSTQLVYHHQVIPEKLSIYLSYGQTLESKAPSWAGIGLSWSSAYF